MIGVFRQSKSLNYEEDPTKQNYLLGDRPLVVEVSLLGEYSRNTLVSVNQLALL